MRLLSCEDSCEMVYGFLDQALSANERNEVEAHLRSCRACHGELERIARVRNLLQGSLGTTALSPEFAAETGRRLKSITTGPVPATLGEDCEEILSAAPAGFLDALASRFGAAPWWVISGAFHALLLMLVALIGMVILRVKDSDTVIVTSLEKKIEKEPEKEQPPRDIFKQPTPLETTATVDPQPEVVMHEEMEVSDHFETDDQMDSNDAFGDEGVSDIPLGGSGFSGAIGVGGGSAGAFGRPLGGGAGRLRRAMAGGGNQKTESAVDKGLEWLARHQEPDGHWDCAKYGGQHADTAVTGFALLAFLGAGHTEKVGKYKDHVARAVGWLIKKQGADGLLAGNINNGGRDHGGKGYNHAIAGMALAEAAAMGRVAETKAAAQKAIDYSVEIHQCGDGSEKRGWRYAPKAPGDLSNSGWFIMQLKSAKVAGLNVPHGGFEGALWFLDHVEDKNFAKNAQDDYDTGRHRYGYTDHTSISYRRTAIGCLCRQFMGTPVEELTGGINWFLSTGGVPGEKNKRDLYYWYYGTLCTFQQGGEIWKKWNDALKPALLDTQCKGGPDVDGSWDPDGRYAGDWGRVGETALAVMCLEVYYRYLPMYR